MHVPAARFRPGPIHLQVSDNPRFISQLSAYSLALCISVHVQGSQPSGKQKHTTAFWRPIPTLRHVGLLLRPPRAPIIAQNREA